MSYFKKSPWIFHYNASSCNGCDIEVLAALTPMYDVERFGIINAGNPKHADILLITGGVNGLVGDIVKNLYDQMPEPRYVISMGSCATSGNHYNSYAVVQGVDQIVPVDVYVPGCPPRPEALLDGLLKLQEKIQREKVFVK